MISLFFLINCCFGEYLIFSNGKYHNNWYEKDSTCHSSTTGLYDQRHILFAQMESDSYLQFHSDKYIECKQYKSLSFALLWEDEFCNLRIKIEFGNSTHLYQVNYQPEILETKKWNRIVIDLTPYQIYKIDTIRISKIDNKDSTLFLNDIQLSTSVIQPGIFQYEIIETSSSLQNEDQERRNNENKSMMTPLMFALSFIISLFI